MPETTTLHLSPSEAADFVLFRKYADLFRDLEAAKCFTDLPCQLVLMLDWQGVLVKAERVKVWRRKKGR